MLISMFESSFACIVIGSTMTTTLFNVVTFDWACLFLSYSLALGLLVLANDWFAEMGWDKVCVISIDLECLVTNKSSNKIIGHIDTT
jgi:hypothetical protein